MDNYYEPEPWYRDGWNVRDKNDAIVAKTLPWDVVGTRDEDHFNVNLIASAPEMFSLLDEVLLICDDTDINIKITDLMGRVRYKTS